MKPAIALILTVLAITAPSLHAQEERVTLVLEEGISGAVWDVAVSMDGRTVYSCGRDSTGKAWNAATGECLRTFRPPAATLVTSLAAGPDDRILALGDMNGHVTIWNVQSGALLADVAAHDAYVQAVVFSRDGRLLYTAGRDDKVSVWDAATGRVVRSFTARSVWVNALALSHDGTRLATAGQDGSIKVWDAATGTFLFSPGYHARYAKTVTFTPDDAMIVSGGRDGRMILWDVKRQVRAADLRIEGGSPRRIALDRSGERAVVCAMDGAVQLWNLRSRTRSQTLAHSYGAMAGAYDRRGARLYTAHTDGAVRVWNAADGTQLVSMVGFTNGQWLTFTPDGYYDCSAFGDAYVKWQGEQGVYPLERYAGLFQQPGIIEDALAGTYVSKQRVERVIPPPRVTILSPRPGQLFSFGSEPLEVVLDVRAQDARKVERLVVSINGRPVREDAITSQDRSAGDTLLTVRARLPVLPGINVIEVAAVNAARVRSETAVLQVRVETQDRLAPNLFVLSVGVDEYAPHFPDLSFASLDARALGDMLARQEGKMYTRVYSTVLINREATRERILAALDAFPPMTRNDVLVLFFGGHGVRQRGTRGETRYYFLPGGVTKTGIPKSGLQWNDLVARVNQRTPGRVILLLDACHSGDVSSGASNEKVASALSADLGIVFASSSGAEYSLENREWGHGAFTKALLDGLGGAADYTRDQIIDWNELQLYVSTAVHGLTGGRQTPMIPRLDQFVPFEFTRLK